MFRFTFPVNFDEMSGFKHHVAIIYVLLLISLISGGSAQNLPQGKCADEFNPDNDYFPDKVTVEDATLFSVEYSKNYKLVTNKFTNEAFALYQCGTPVPSDLPKNVKPFPVSVNNVAVTDDTSVNAFLEMLGFRSSIKLLGTADSVSSPCIQSLRDSGDITVLGTNETFNALELSKVDLAFGAAEAGTDPKTVSTSSSREPGILNRVEWIKFYSVFFNAESKANEIYGKIKSNYGCFRDFVNKKNKEKPTVAWVSYDAPSEFNQNTASWKIVDAPFKKSLTEDAGGTYFNSSTLSFNTSSDFLKSIENVDILIDETYIANNSSDVYKNFGLDDQQQQYKFVKNRAIYREDGLTNPNDGRDWFENAVVMGDALLEDMINVINPSLPKPDYQRIWLRNVAKDEKIKITSAKDCVPDKPLVSKADDCPSVSAKGEAGDGTISSTPIFFPYFVAFVLVNSVMILF